MQRGKYIEVEKSEDIWRLEKNAVWREKKTDANHIHTIVVFAIGINSIMIASMFLREEGKLGVKVRRLLIVVDLTSQ